MNSTGGEGRSSVWDIGQAPGAEQMAMGRTEVEGRRADQRRGE
jgi:hypothetical protein